ncbi:unnamed protein product [Symbiodinium necroappetens]|uniref:Uncharacterized protein n=1 Tax=Symbiodinium necroappetens TaxID=1628268 RepID=A0A812PLM3_9DINO|nr:unnamed protein product [Symbiodinium necroappetens]|mmetsp:Transcript_111704/g.266460  ORF Transcript_111704/g.266460 Transcript_111704/m.266460 type:complete len:365 (+) Transcript_111704:42-1136(+)
MERILTCIYNIPICGGFCAPTQSPEKGILRHFSNEYTLPLAGVFMKLRGCLETNACCRHCGATGIAFGRAHRRGLMVTSFWISFIAWLLNIYAVLALSHNAQVLKATAWATGTFGYGGPYLGAKSWVGLGGRVDEVDCGMSEYTDGCNKWFRENAELMKEVSPGLYQRVVAFGNTKSCAGNIVYHNAKLADLVAAATNETVYADTEMCEGCEKSAGNTVSFAIMGIITQIPQMTTDLQRSTRFGDVNCQATMGAITSCWGTFSGLTSLTSFSYSCWRKFPRLVRDKVGDIEYKWSMGPGFACMLIATVLKLWDALAHAMVPTPLARQSKPPKGVELFEYMSMAEKPQSEESEGSHTEDSDEVGV